MRNFEFQKLVVIYDFLGVPPPMMPKGSLKIPTRRRRADCSNLFALKRIFFYDDDNPAKRISASIPHATHGKTPTSHCYVAHCYIDFQIFKLRHCYIDTFAPSLK
ncbi:MAG: hypothetical protein IR153_05445 [Flavobacterium sp.]|nr:hypothetical protein [Flavobacterium sp.]